MTIDSSVINALNVLLLIVIYSLYVASPLIILQLMMYGHEHYKKWKAKEQKEAERIIVKMNEKIASDAAACDTLLNQKTQLKLEVESLEKTKKQLQHEVGVEDKPDVEENQDLSELNIKQLQKLAKAQGVKRYSKLKKADLLKALGA
jgi:hypothetical protein